MTDRIDEDLDGSNQHSVSRRHFLVGAAALGASVAAGALTG
ncbi:MAG: twin-arginine translocation signal domain-containing protein [Coriobacteriia bacterium]